MGKWVLDQAGVEGKWAGVVGYQGFSGAMNVAPTSGSSHPLCQWAVMLRLPSGKLYRIG